jgi:hypothetical protein
MKSYLHARALNKEIGEYIRECGRLRAEAKQAAEKQNWPVVRMAPSTGVRS